MFSWQLDLIAMRRRARAIAMLCCFVGLVLSTTSHALVAQDITALQAAATMEAVLVKTIATAEESVVAITRVRNSRFQIDPYSDDFVPNEYGTGVIISENGYIVTMGHVLGNTKENSYYVWHKRKPYKVTAQNIHGVDPWTDLAVIKIEAEELKPIKFGDAEKLKKGMIAIALGNPYAIARDGEVSASWGIIANLQRKAPPNESAEDPTNRTDTVHHYGNLIHTDAKLNLGTSGGALVNLKGELIGITTSLAARAGYEKSAGFAVPVDATFKRVVKALRAKRVPEFGFLGVAPEDLSAAERRRGRHGVVLTEVVPGTPAQQHGLVDNDVITHIDGKAIFGRSDLLRELSKRDVRSQVELSVKRARNGVTSNRKVPVTLLKKYIPRATENAGELWRGMRVDYSTALPTTFLTRQIGNITFSECIGVVYVKYGSPAWRAGIRRGEFIERVDGRLVSKPEDFDELVRDNDDAIEITMAGRGDDTRRVEAPVIGAEFTNADAADR